uniref:Uncharacterized protein n=1 Tax=Moniliophthora roreri TaxID=221103 RepID=A0A0W0GAR3_MONRR
MSHKVSSVIGCDVSVLLAASGDIVEGVFGIKSGVEHIADGSDVAHDAGGVIGGNMSDSVGVIGNIERDVVEAVAGIGNIVGIVIVSVGGRSAGAEDDDSRDNG